MIRFTTRNGSVYEIDETTRTWARVSYPEWSAGVRSSGGSYREFRYGLNEPLIIIADPLENTDADCRVIETSPVVNAERV